MDHTYVIKRPVMTEKATMQATEQGWYSFVVDTKATKRDIRAAVESLYKVNVVKVNTMVHKSKQRATRFGVMGGDLTKKAMIKLKEGDKIELF